MKRAISLACVVLASMATAEIGPGTILDDVPGSATVRQIVQAGSDGIDTNAVREIAREIVEPAATAATNYTDRATGEVVRLVGALAGDVATVATSATNYTDRATGEVVRLVGTVADDVATVAAAATNYTDRATGEVVRLVGTVAAGLASSATNYTDRATGEVVRLVGVLADEKRGKTDMDVYATNTTAWVSVDEEGNAWPHIDSLHWVSNEEEFLRYYGGSWWDPFSVPGWYAVVNEGALLQSTDVNADRIEFDTAYYSDYSAFHHVVLTRNVAGRPTGDRLATTNDVADVRAVALSLVPRIEDIEGSAVTKTSLTNGTLHELKLSDDKGMYGGGYVDIRYDELFGYGIWMFSDYANTTSYIGHSKSPGGWVTCKPGLLVDDWHSILAGDGEQNESLKHYVDSCVANAATAATNYTDVATSAVSRIVTGEFEIRADLSVKIGGDLTDSWSPSSAEDSNPWIAYYEPQWDGDKWVCNAEHEDYGEYITMFGDATNPDATELYYPDSARTLTRRVRETKETRLATTNDVAAAVAPFGNAVTNHQSYVQFGASHVADEDRSKHGYIWIGGTLGEGTGGNGRLILGGAGDLDGEGEIVIRRTEGSAGSGNALTITHTGDASETLTERIVRDAGTAEVAARADIHPEESGVESDVRVQIGYNATATGPAGKDAKYAGRNQSIAIGYNATATNWTSVAIGSGGWSVNTNEFGVETGRVVNAATADGREAIAIGYGSKANGDMSTAVGKLARAHGDYSAAFGAQSVAGQHGVAIGFGADAARTRQRGIAIGRYAVADAENAVQLFTGVNETANSIKIGDTFVWRGGHPANEDDPRFRTFTNSLFKVDPARFNAAIGHSAAVVTTEGTTTNTSSVAIGRSARVEPAYGDAQASIAIGMQTTSANISSITIGHSSSNYGKRSVAIGRDVVISNDVDQANMDAIAIGYQAKVYNHQGIAIGKSAVAENSGAVQIGTGANSEAYSLKFRGTTIVGSDGKIPSASLGMTTLAIGGMNYTVGTATISGHTVMTLTPAP